ncbi:MAG: LysM peptidoglycan-binding domain-containing protein [Thermoleophilaceae bacterium]
MPQHRRRRSAARLFAPLALLAAFGAVGYVVANSTGAGDDGSEAATDRTTEQRPRQREDEPPRRQRTFYRVKLNDTLGLIAEKTEVPVERLEELNPELDPQNLVVGQRIRLRE